MKDFIKKGAKGAADLGSSAMKAALTALLADIAKEMLEETGVADLAKDQIMDVGTKIIKDMGVNPTEVKKDLIKAAIKKELNID